MVIDLSHGHEIRFAALRALPWVAEEPVPGLSVRRCIERIEANGV